MTMANVREVFPNLERLRRVRRGAKPQKAWTKAPPFVQVAAKLAPMILDTQVRQINNGGELHRLLLRAGNNFGYVLLKPSNYALEKCRSYDEFQRVFSSMEGEIRWERNFQDLLGWLERNCTSPSYVERVKKVRV
jgi:hypothetical protein